jgi:hypothetical protein
MATHKIQIMVPAPVAMPRGALWAASAFAALGRAFWLTMEQVGQRRAAREMRALASHLDRIDPERASMLREASNFENAAREAAKVRELADTYRRSDPGFASDLYAAANRHEAQFTPPTAG